MMSSTLSTNVDGHGKITAYVLLEHQLRAVAERARIEADAGAPGSMVATYVAGEIEHLVDGPGHHEEWCDTCERAREQK